MTQKDVLILRPEWRTEQRDQEAKELIRSIVTSSNRDKYGYLARELGRRILPGHEEIARQKNRLKNKEKFTRTQVDEIRVVSDSLKRDHQIIANLGWTPGDAIKAHKKSAKT